ncbi:MAG TPA: chromate resistance protein ChrB domain-containing protein [Candidatus Binatia bacterium]|nr:chromate resistance protein ChrB domain-containing protein [Candidatus Binatia bacterium]
MNFYRWPPGRRDRSRETGRRYLPFDVANVELGHNGLECTFDAIIKKYHFHDRARARLAQIGVFYSVDWDVSQS